jgi:hypothetical protein
MDGSTGRPDYHRAAREAANAAPWPAPDAAFAAAETLPAPPLPLDLFPGAWGPWIARAAEGAGAPPDYVACALLAAVGALLGNARWGEPKPGEWAEPPILNVALVGNPSAGKSPALDRITGPLAAVEREDNADMEDRLRDHRTVRQAAKEHRSRWEAEVKEAVKLATPPPPEPPAAVEPEKPSPHRIRTTDATREAVRDLAVANPRGLMLVRDELAGWLASMDRYGNAAAGGDRAFYLEAYGGREHVADRVKDRAEGREGGTVIPHLTVGVLGGIQPDRCASLMMGGDDDGLSARFLYTWPEPVPVTDGRGDALSPLFARAARRLRDLPWTPPEPLRLPFTEEARAHLLEWRREVRAMEAGAAGIVLSWTGKLPGFAVRLAVIFAHLAWTGSEAETPAPAEVTGDDMARALAFLSDYAAPMARRVFGEATLPDRERDARRLARWYLRQPVPRPETLNARTLRRMAEGPGMPDAERMGAALAELVELGWLRPDPAREGGHTGRNRGDWAVHPAVQGWRP